MGKNSYFTEVEYAEYMLAKKYLGHSEVALYIAAVLFEKYIFQKVKSNKSYEKAFVEFLKKQDSKKENLYDAIEFYAYSNLWQTDILYMQVNLAKNNTIKKLHLYRKLRNDIVHVGMKKFHDKDRYKISETGEEVILNEFIEYVYRVITSKSIKPDFFEFNATKTLLQDYKVKEIDERMISSRDGILNTTSKWYKKFTGFVADDFNNLFNLRNKLVILQKYISSKLHGEVGLQQTILSPIDTTSAYIWMPFVDKDFIESSNIIETERHNLVMGSVSILATPVDFRIYIDFGGGDIDFRTTYQQFLKSEKFKKYIIRRFKEEELQLKVFETRWYSFIVDKKNLFDVIDQETFDKQVENALIFLKNAKAQGNIITSGRNLLGYVLPSSEDISKEFILDKFKDIAHIYYEYLIFKYPNREKELRKKQSYLYQYSESKKSKNTDEFSMDSIEQYDYEDESDDFGDTDYMNPINLKRKK